MELAQKVAFLRQPGAYPFATEGVDVIETHMSWVFLAGGHVYKLKKPVRYSYLDFRTVDARHQDCLEEVRLNRRLANGIYLGVVPLVAGSIDSLSLGGKGCVVDWLVHMRRLPGDRMLDYRIRRSLLQADEIDPAAHRLADFYRGLSPVEITPAENRRRFRDDIEENHSELTDPAFGLSASQIDDLCGRHQRFLDQEASVIDRRVLDGRVIEGHGDLRPQHVCLTDPPVVIDCLEFNRDFRLLDAADELAYLSLECERLGAAPAGRRFFAIYRRVTGDHPPPPLLHFYASFRATLRAKIAIWHNRDDGIREPDKWVRRARAYLALAEQHARHF